ncbi:hypothetical protein FACS189419_06700 [Planctomycetales bacterium]|nr:hypothetical protein FACS189419_06700 [Planctomycetales bacterium]
MKKLVFAILFLTVLGAGSYYGWQYMRATVKVEPPQMTYVKKETFTHEILERGSVESASNIDVACEVESGNGITIITVVPEGTIVKKGDLLVELDSSELREKVTTQQIAVLTSKADLAQAEADVQTAELTLKEYIEGTYKQNQKTYENDIFKAEEDVRTKEDSLAFYKRLLERGYVTDAKVDTDIIDLDKAKNELSIAKLKLHVLDNYTKEKSVVEYQAKIEASKSKRTSKQQSLRIDEEKLKHLEKVLGLCKIYAPQNGQVVYFMPRWGGDEDIIKEGKKVYERQVIIRLPDLSQMQVKGLVNEATVRLVKEGQKATVRLEAFPNKVFDGTVKTVNDYPEPSNWMGGNMSKEYSTTITVNNPPDGIKTGLTAEAKITVNVINDALVLPVQAVLEHGGKTYVVTFQDGKWDKVEIQSGASNGKEVVILDGLKENDSVVLGAAVHRDKINLPKVERKDGENKKPGNGERERPKAAAVPPAPKSGT